MGGPGEVVEQLFCGRAGQASERRCWGLAKAKVKSHFKDGISRLQVDLKKEEGETWGDGGAWV